MAELADALDLGSSGLFRAGSSPVTRTIGESVRTIRTLNIFQSVIRLNFLLYKNSIW